MIDNDKHLRRDDDDQGGGAGAGLYDRKNTEKDETQKQNTRITEML